ncbi:MAG: thioredoxin family protein [Bacteroidota bacterium]
MTTDTHLPAEIEHAVSYADYYTTLETEALEGTPNPAMHKYVKLAYQRTKRIHKTYQPSDAVRAALDTVKAPQTWLVITETWCGDSGQLLPFVADIAALNPAITLRILARDEHLDVMDRYLTNGSRAIPKLIAFDEQGTELFQWGPRPTAAADLFRTQREAGVDKPDIYKALSGWYARDKGASVEEELIAALAG